MKKILLACSAGMSTSILEKNMRDYIVANKLDIKVDAVDSGTAKSMMKDYDVVLLGPQVRYMETGFKAVATTQSIGVIPMQMYGLMKGKETVELALELIKNK